MEKSPWPNHEAPPAVCVSRLVMRCSLKGSMLAVPEATLHNGKQGRD